MKKILLSVTIFILLNVSASFSEEISRILTYNGPGNQVDQCNAIVQDRNGYVYATGVSWGGASKEDYATVKFGENGDYLWVARYNGPGNNLDHASAITIDNSGNVYVTGWSRTSSSYGSEDFLTIKYNNNGVQLWTARFDGSVGNDCYYYDYARAITVDAAGNVYVTGTSWGNDDLRDDYVTIKYNTSGQQQWAKRYNGPSSKEDKVSSLSLDASGNVYVTGASYNNGKGYDVLTVKYNNSGQQQWTARYDGPAYLDDMGSEVKADLGGNVFVTGSSHGGNSKLDYVTIKYNGAGQQQWLKRFNGSANDTDAATGVDIDVYGNAYVTGYSKSTGAAGYDFSTIKYSATDGTVLWSKLFNGVAMDKPWDIKVIYKPCAATGVYHYSRNEPGDPGWDVPCWDIDIYVTGQSVGNSNSNDFMTIRYTEFGVQKWANRFNSPGNGSDMAYSISVFNGYPVVYAGGTFGSDYGIIGISEGRPSDNNIIGGLSSNYPNPFNPETKISFNVAKESFVKITVFDVLGKTVAVLADSKYAEGNYSVNFNASNLNSGVYFYRFETEYASETKKIVLVK